MCPEKDKGLPDYWQEECEHSIVKSSDFSREASNPDLCACVKFQVSNFGSNLLSVFSPALCGSNSKTVGHQFANLQPV